MQLAVRHADLSIGPCATVPCACSTCYGNGQITKAFGGTYLSMSASRDPTLDRLEFGAANVSVSPAAREAVNASWAQLIPDWFIVNEMHDNMVYALAPGATHLAWSQRTPVETFVVGPYNNVLGFQVGRAWGRRGAGPPGSPGISAWSCSTAWV